MHTKADGDGAEGACGYFVAMLFHGPNIHHAGTVHRTPEYTRNARNNGHAILRVSASLRPGHGRHREKSIASRRTLQGTT